MIVNGMAWGEVIPLLSFPSLGFNFWLAENGPSVQVQPSSNAQLLGDQNVDSALSPEITETVLEAADDGCTSAPAFRCMVYDGI